MSVRVGVVSDTHGLIRPAPLVAVRGNNDRGAWADALPETVVVDVGGVRICVVHELPALRVDPKTAGIGVVVSGHSHRPSIERRQGVVYVNPGSAGPRRFSLPIAVAVLRLDGSRVAARVVTLA
jgi:putative phosphoesterase